MRDFIVIDKSRFKDAVKAYWLWKELNSIIKNSHNRGINFPETISETLACYALGFELNRGTGGDARDQDNRILEIKASSNWDRDTTSFSPREEFDDLYFVRLNQREDTVYIYDLKINSDGLKSIKVNKNQTLKDQQDQGRRPRFSVINKIIEENDYQPIASVDIRKEKVNKL